MNKDTLRMPDGELDLSTAKTVETTNLTLRDAQQSKKAGRFRRHNILALAHETNEMGYDSNEVDGGTRGEIPLTFLGEHPWQNLQEVRAAMPGAKLQMLGRGQSGEGKINYADDVIDAFYTAKVDNGINVFRLFDAMNDFRNLETAIDALKRKKEQGADVTIEGCLSFTKSPIHTTEYWVSKARKLKDKGVDRLCIKDMAGLMTKKDARELIPALKAVGLPITLHMHATNGIAEATLLEALDLDIDKIDLADHDLSGGSGHVSSKRFMFLAQNDPRPKVRARAPRIELGSKEFSDNLLEAGLINRAKEVPHDPEVQEQLLASGIPGGMLATFKDNVMPQLLSQIKALKKQGVQIPDKLNWEKAMPEMLEEIVRVREDFGYVPLVTPTSQVVAIQAAMNYLNYLNRGDDKKLSELSPEERYGSLTNGSKGYLLGHLGKNIQDPDDWLVKWAEAITGTKRTKDRHSASLPPGLPPARDRIKAKAKEALEQLKKDVGLSDDFNASQGLSKRIKSRNVRQRLDDIINKDIPIEDVLLAAMFDLAPKSDGTHAVINRALETPENMPSFEAEPDLPDLPFYKDQAYAAFGVRKTIGAMTLERLSQAGIELTRLQDGTIKDLSPELHQKWADEVASEMDEIIQDMALSMADNNFNAGQMLLSGDVIEPVLRERAKELGTNSAVLQQMLKAVQEHTHEYGMRRGHKQSAPADSPVFA